jgi:hypothetical protein
MVLYFLCLCISRRIKSVRFTKVEEEARPRVISLPGRLISGLLNAAGRGQNKVIFSCLNGIQCCALACHD